ncbi:MAG: transcription antitermination factor NusB [Coriobacteriia bacterium]|nr:transcription antitermination factor NusB [Coriobacteriia bacterium]
MSKKHKNTGARRAALQALYAGAIAEKKAAFLIAQGLFLEDSEKMSDYAEQLVAGTERYQKEIDSYLEEASDNWALDRMPIVDRTILRLAVYEMVYEINVPLSVTINEAVELAKAFGGEDDSPRFVNGVLGRIAKRLEAAVSPAASEEAEQGESAAAEAAPEVAAEPQVEEAE